MKLIRNALNAGIKASYVLMDTWFTNEPFIANILAEGLDVIGMLKDNKQYYIYNIVNFEGTLKNEGFKVTVDNGKTIEKLRDKDGNRIVFTTPAGALMYFISKGWELYSHGSTTEGAVFNGAGASESSTYWILRKPCTKEEFDKTVNDAVKK